MATTDHSPGGHTLPNGAPLNHEPTDVSLAGVTRIAILSWLLIFVIMGGVYGFWKLLVSFTADTRELPPINVYAPGQDRLPRGPLVLTDEPGALRQLRAKEHEVLDSYGWVDKNQGIVRVPIDRAIDILAEHPDRIAPTGGSAVATPAPATPAPTTPAAPETAKPPAAH